MAIQFCETRYASYELNNANKRGREKEIWKADKEKKEEERVVYSLSSIEAAITKVKPIMSPNC